MFTCNKNLLPYFGPQNNSFNETIKHNKIPMVQQPGYVKNITSLKNMTSYLIDYIVISALAMTQSSVTYI